MFTLILFLKWILVAIFLFFGAAVLLMGLGAEVPLIKYKGLEAYGVPAGVILMAASIAIAAFWKISYKVTTTEKDRYIDKKITADEYQGREKSRTTEIRLDTNKKDVDKKLD
jgi:hypothetical protein